MRKLFLFFIICISIMFSSNTKSGANEVELDSNTDVYELPNDVNEWEIKDSVGKIIDIKIRGNPTTGYGWFLVNAGDVDINVLKPLNLNQYNSANDFVVDEHPTGMVGVGGYYHFKFQALKAGQDLKLKFVNKRPWEEQNDREVIIKVTIS